jgi:hypothetical protein
MSVSPNGRGILYVVSDGNPPTFIAFCTSQQAAEILQGEEYGITVAFESAWFVDNNDWLFMFTDGSWKAEPDGPETQTQGLGEILFL